MAGDSLDGCLAFGCSRLWNLYRPLLDPLRFAHGHSRAGKNARIQIQLYVAGRRVKVVSPHSRTAPPLTRRPAPGTGFVGFRARETFLQADTLLATLHMVIHCLERNLSRPGEPVPDDLPRARKYSR